MLDALPKVSLVVPTYNQSRLLLRLLRSLQTLANVHEVELIIVDDRSTDDTQMQVGIWMEEALPFFDVRYLRQERNLGPGEARNRGLGTARAALTAFTDTDCVSDPDWLGRLVAPLGEHPAWAGTGGRVLPLNGALLTAQYFTVMRALEPPASLQYLITCNCCFRTQPLLEAGGFTTLSKIAGGEDIAACIRLWKAGWRFGFVENAVVYHDYRPGLAEFRRTWRAYGRGTQAVFLSLLSPEERAPNQATRPDANHWDGALNYPAVTGLRSLIRDTRRTWEHLSASGVGGLRRIGLMALHLSARFAYLKGWREASGPAFIEGEERLRKKV